MIPCLLVCLATWNSLFGAEPPLALSGRTTAPSTEPALAFPQPIADDEVETILVVADPFKRWDRTRWFVKTELVLPFTLRFHASKNYEFASSAFQVRTILACEKEWKVSNRKFQILCSIEDFGIQASALDAETDTAERRQRTLAVLEEIDQKLSGAAVQLIVTRNGRVVDIDLEGLSKRNRREATISETLRLLMSRIVVGFDLKLDPSDFKENGKYIEYTSALMGMPILRQTAQGASIVIHRLQTLDGHSIVESRGKGNLQVMNANWSTEFAGVAVYDRREAFMKERVWTLVGTPTASNWTGSRVYNHAGRIVKLHPEQHPSVGPTTLVSFPHRATEGLRTWTPIEE